MAEEDTKEAMNQTEEPKRQRSLLSFFTNTFFPRMITNNRAETNPGGELSAKPPGKESTGVENSGEKPDVVKFSEPKPVVPPPLKIEIEDPEQNPLARWSVYALGGFLVLKWALARWKEMKERKGKKESSDDNEPPAPAPAPAPMPAPDDESYRSAQNSS